MKFVHEQQELPPANYRSKEGIPGTAGTSYWHALCIWNIRQNILQRSLRQMSFYLILKNNSWHGGAIQGSKTTKDNTGQQSKKNPNANQSLSYFLSKTFTEHFCTLSHLPPHIFPLKPEHKPCPSLLYSSFENRSLNPVLLSALLMELVSIPTFYAWVFFPLLTYQHHTIPFPCLLLQGLEFLSLPNPRRPY